MFNYHKQLFEAHSSFTVDEKDFNRMQKLFDAGKPGDGVARTITDPGKAAARFVAGLIVAKSQFPSRDDINNDECLFSSFGKRAFELGCTYDMMKLMYDNYATEDTNNGEERNESNSEDFAREAENPNRTIMWFNNLSAAFLFYWEELGLISDGKYENSRPYGHYAWLPSKGNIIVDRNCDPHSKRVYVGREAYNCYYDPKKYNIRDIIKYTGDVMLCYGRFGKIFNNDLQRVFDKFTYEGNSFRVICGLLGNTKKFEDVDDFLDNIINKSSYAASYVNGYRRFLTLDVYDKYYEINYTLADLKNDLQAMDATVNNFGDYCSLEY